MTSPLVTVIALPRIHLNRRSKRGRGDDAQWTAATPLTTELGQPCGLSTSPPPRRRCRLRPGRSPPLQERSPTTEDSWHHLSQPPSWPSPLGCPVSARMGGRFQPDWVAAFGRNARPWSFALLGWSEGRVGWPGGGSGQAERAPSSKEPSVAIWSHSATPPPGGLGHGSSSENPVQPPASLRWLAGREVFSTCPHPRPGPAFSPAADLSSPPRAGASSASSLAPGWSAPGGTP